MGPTSSADELDLIDDLAVDDQLRAFLADLRSAYAHGPAPVTTTRLASVLERGLAGGGVAPDGLPAAVPPRVGPRSRQPLVDRLQSRRLRLGLGAAVAGLTVFGTGAAGALPGPVQSVFERTVEVVGIELPEEVRTPEPVPVPGEGAPMEAPPGGDSGAGSTANSPTQTDAPPAQAGNNPPATAPSGPLGGAPGEGGTGDTPGDQSNRDARPELPGNEGRGGLGAPEDGVPAPVTPGRTGRPDLGSPPGDPQPDDDETPGESERLGLQDWPASPGQGASPLGRVQSSDRADARSPR